MKRKAITAVFTVLLLSAVFIQPTHANSAQRHWSGTDSTGALVKEKNCPLVVDKELLTFDVQEFPKNYYNSTEEFLTYTGKVTAEYTFRNPADYAVTATLVFPFGNLCRYYYVNTIRQPRHLHRNTILRHYVKPQHFYALA